MMSSNVLLCPQPKDIQRTVTEDEKKTEDIHIQKLESESFPLKELLKQINPSF